MQISLRSTTLNKNPVFIHVKLRFDPLYPFGPSLRYHISFSTYGHSWNGLNSPAGKWPPPIKVSISENSYCEIFRNKIVSKYTKCTDGMCEIPMDRIHQNQRPITKTCELCNLPPFDLYQVSSDWNYSSATLIRVNHTYVSCKTSRCKIACLNHWSIQVEQNWFTGHFIGQFSWSFHGQFNKTWSDKFVNLKLHFVRCQESEPSHLSIYYLSNFSTD